MTVRGVLLKKFLNCRVGDNLKIIGKEFGISVKKLCSYNEIPKDYPLDPGMVIYLEKKNKKAGALPVR